MAIAEVAARDWIFEINTGSEATPNWVEIGGISKHKPERKKKNTDVTKYVHKGITSVVPMSIGFGLKLEGDYLADPDTGARDPGQEACETLSDGLGPVDGIKQFRMTAPSGAAKVAKACCDAGSTGGGNDDMAGWECSIDFVEKPV